MTTEFRELNLIRFLHHEELEDFQICNKKNGKLNLSKIGKVAMNSLS